MSATTWLRVSLGTILVLVLVAGLLYLYTERISHADSEAAGISADLLPVGTEYGGLVLEQHVEVGDTVAAGDVLLTIDSSQLEDELASQVQILEAQYEADLAVAEMEAQGPEPSASPAPEPPVLPEVTRQWQVVAAANGTVADIPIAQGGYVGSGGIVAEMFAAESLFVDATFRVDGDDLPAISEGAAAVITLPDDTTLDGSVETIRFAQDELGTVMVLEVASSELEAMDPAGAATPGTPVHATVEISPSGPLADLRRAADSAIAGIGQ
ncbi:HlyD family efflux transporter periplasmic adaptor subunit [Demequina sp. NBRC 110053]|uniref:HlyD family efflux transporter periplasmic adaptor subunit n=1 Tax=Demequina sp. NBRC 110053 TaxID=1570342 RepID=UPI000A05CBEC|nr:HlyD family efflux transporter periplasmic adaptor subunit [Demequina sp. NBRC 110053]